MTEPFYHNDTIKSIKLAQQGNKKELTKLCQQYEGLIRKYANVTAVKCESEDMEHHLWELFIRAIKEYKTEGTVPFSGFIQSRIRYGQYNEFKKMRRQWQHESFIMNAPTESKDPHMTLEDFISPSDSAEDMTLAKQDRIQIAKAFHQLPELQQKLLYAYYIKNISLATLARQHGISRQAMQQHKNRALVALTVYFNKLSLK